VEDDREMLCFEPVSEQYIKVSHQRLLMAELMANKAFHTDGEFSINQWLALLGGKYSKKCEGIGWLMSDPDGTADFNWSFYRGAPWIDVQPKLGKNKHGRDVLVLSYGMYPMEMADWTNDSNGVLTDRTRVESMPKDQIKPM
jgi:hypothetical protein